MIKYIKMDDGCENAEKTKTENARLRTENPKHETNLFIILET